MSRPKKTPMELRHYELNPYFPVKLLSGDYWMISDTPAKHLHFHNCLEIGYCHDGCGTLSFNNTSYEFKERDISIISCDIPHTTWSKTGALSLWSYLFVDLSLLLGPAYGLSAAAGQWIPQRLESDFCTLIHHQDCPVIQTLVVEIIRELTEEKPFYEDSVRGLFASLSIHIVRECKQQPDHHPAAAKNMFSIKPALDSIRNQYMNHIEMSALAESCNLSDSHFRKLFTEITGFSPLEYRNRFRIEKACVLLRISELSILDISEAVGFGSLSSFNRHFLAVMNMTPSDYRLQHAAVLKDRSIVKYHGWMMPEK